MGSFTDVVNGHIMFAADVNQLCDALNGVVSSQLAVYGGSTNANVPWTLQLPSAATGTAWLWAGVNGDTWNRVSLYYTNAGACGIGVSAGTGSAWTGQMEASTNVGGGWNVLQNLQGTANLTFSGASTWASLAVGGAGTVTGNTTVNGGSGTINVDAANVVAGGTWLCANGSTMTWNDDGTNINLVPTRSSSNAARTTLLAGVDTSNGGHAGWVVDTSGNTVQQFSALYLQPSSGHRTSFSAIATFSGNLTSGSTAFYSHGLSVAPDAVLVCTGTTAAPNAWATASASNYGSSGCTVTLGAGGTWGVQCLAFKS